MSKLFRIGAALFAAACLPTGFASAQVVSFSNGTFSNDSFLNLVGTEVYGVATNNSTSAIPFTTQNGYVFQNSGTALAQSEIEGSNFGSGPFIGFLQDDRDSVTTTSGDAGLDGIINTSLYSGNVTYALNGLTAGLTYNVLIFAADARYSSGDSVLQLKDGTQTSALQQFVFPGGLTPASPSQVAGGYVLESFKATGTTETITDDTGQEIQGILVGITAAPEPSVYVLTLAGLGAVVALSMRRRQRSV